MSEDIWYQSEKEWKNVEGEEKPSLNLQSYVMENKV